MFHAAVAIVIPQMLDARLNLFNAQGCPWTSSLGVRLQAQKVCHFIDRPQLLPTDIRHLELGEAALQDAPRN